MRTVSLHRDGTCLLPGVAVADTWWRRLRGLLFGRRLGEGGRNGLLLEPCASVHTIGMRYPLDIVFLDRAGRVLAVRADVGAWRARARRGAHSTLELRAGAAHRLGIEPGQTLHLEAAA